MIRKAFIDAAATTDPADFRARQAERLRRVGLPESEVKRLLDLIVSFRARRTLPSGDPVDSTDGRPSTAAVQVPAVVERPDPPRDQSFQLTLEFEQVRRDALQTG